MKTGTDAELVRGAREALVNIYMFRTLTGVLVTMFNKLDFLPMLGTCSLMLNI